MLSKGPFLALLLWYSEKVGARLERDESVLMSKLSREEGAISGSPLRQVINESRRVKARSTPTASR
jgi:hypothetical protein